MVGDVRVAERVDVEEAEHRKERAAEEEQCGKRRTCARANRPQRERDRDEREVEVVLPDRRRIHRPVRVGEDEVGWPDDRPEIEADHAPGEQRALEHVEIVLRACGSDQMPLDPRGEQPARRGDREPRQQRHHVTAPLDSSALPPEHHEQRGRERRRHRLGHQRAEEQRARYAKVAGLARVVEPQVRDCGEQVEHERERVLLFGDPRDRLDVDGMEREDRAGEPRALDGEPLGERDDEARRDHVQHDVHEVVAEHGVAPEARLDPERAVQERIVLLRGAELGPNAAQSIERAERGPGDMRVVVPDVLTEERGPVDEEGQAEEQQPAPGVGGAADGAAGGAGRWPLGIDGERVRHVL